MTFFQGIKDYLGIGRGKIDVAMQKLQYSAGETVEGNILLKLNKPVEATELSMELFCNQTTTRWVSDNSGRHRESATERMFDFTQPIDGAKTYPLGDSSYAFQIKIPADISFRPKLPDGFLGKVGQVLEATSQNPVSREWWLVARLAVKGLDTVKRVQINVG